MVIKKTNKQMMILSFMGIVFVVDNHCGQPLSFLTSIFPYNSFFMPMFVFISGYFFNPELLLNLKNFILHKIKNLIKPFLIYNLILGGGGLWCLNCLMFIGWAHIL